jgi:hypothetical protein
MLFLLTVMAFPFTNSRVACPRLYSDFLYYTVANSLFYECLSGGFRIDGDPRMSGHVYSCEFYRCSLDTLGAGFYFTGEHLVVFGCTFLECHNSQTASSFLAEGSIMAEQDQWNITEVSSTAGQGDYIIRVEYGKPSIGAGHLNFTSNFAYSDGEVIALMHVSVLDLHDWVFDGNSNTDGVYLSNWNSNSSRWIRCFAFHSNYCTHENKALFDISAPLSICDSIFSANQITSLVRLPASLGPVTFVGCSFDLISFGDAGRSSGIQTSSCYVGDLPFTLPLACRPMTPVVTWTRRATETLPGSRTRIPITTRTVSGSPRATANDRSRGVADNPGQVIGIAVGAAAGCAAIGFFVLWLCKKTGTADSLNTGSELLSADRSGGQ